MIFRRLAVPLMLVVAITGCSNRYGVSGPEDLGLAARFNALTLPTLLDPNAPNKKLTRNQVLNQWIIKSDFLCADYQLQLSRAIRDARLATDVSATILSGLATILASPAVTRPLAGAATMALGIGGDIQSDLFLQQAGDVVGTAIQAVRTRARTELQKKFTAEYSDYTLEQGLVDVQRYDRETCNLNVGLNEIRASLNLVGPLASQANNPIIPLPRPTADAGSVPESAPSGATAPMATTIIPPSVQKTPEGGLVFTPGKLVSTPAAAPPTTTAPRPPIPGRSPPPAPPPQPPVRTPVVISLTPELSQLFVALGSDPEGKKKYDRTRVAIMRTCFLTIGIRPAPAVVDFITDPKFTAKFPEMTNCINAGIR